MMLAMTLGWSEIYLICLLTGLVFTVISGLLSGVGGHHVELHGGHDLIGHGGDLGGSDGDGSSPSSSALEDPSVHFSPLSPVVLAMFVTVFGAVGLLGQRGLGLPWLVHLLLAAVSGVALSGVTFYLFARIVRWAQGSSQTSVLEALGSSAEVIVPIPPGGLGRVAYTVQDSRFTAAARSTDGGPIATHTIVTIEECSGPVFLVRESDEEKLRKLTAPPGGEVAKPQ